MEDSKTFNAATLGLGFHQFDGNVSVKEVIDSIGANFQVREDKLVRLPEDLIAAIQRGESVNIDPSYIISTHKATVHADMDQTIGIVGADYGTIQNTTAFDMLDMMCNASVSDNPLQIVSAGLVHNFDPYLQAKLPTTARIKGDPSETEFFVFAHTSHDGTSGLQIRFSPVRVYCQNTFMANVSSKLGLTFKHSKYVQQRVDLTQEVNVKRVTEMIGRLGIMTQEYIDQMNEFAKQNVTDNEINEFVLNLFVNDEAIKKIAREHNYNLHLVEGASTRTRNMVDSFKDTLYSSNGAQDFAYGTKLWLFNGTTNYLSNVASYGSAKDTTYARAEKRFDSLLSGASNKRMDKAMTLLTA